MFLYKFIDEFPEIPAHLVANINEHDPGVLMRDYAGREHIKDGRVIMSSSNPFYYANTDLEAWVRLRICREFNDMGVRFAFGKPDVNTAGVHTDETRHYVLMYNLDNGGGHLKFWQEKGQPLERDGRYLVTDYSKLDLVETVETPNNRWYLINARVLHSVEGITSTRINVQVSLNNTVQIV